MANTMAVDVRIDTVYSDGSGAPATVSFRGFYFAADYLGESRITLVAPRNRTPPRWVIEAVRRSYLKELQTRADAQWFTANRAMYSESSVA